MNASPKYVTLLSESRAVGPEAQVKP